MKINDSMTNTHTHTHTHTHTAALFFAFFYYSFFVARNAKRISMKAYTKGFHENPYFPYRHKDNGTFGTSL